MESKGSENPLPEAETAMKPKSEDEIFLERAYAELALAGDGRQPTDEEVHDQALRIKFRGMQSNALENIAVNAYIAEAAHRFNEMTDQSMRTADAVSAGDGSTLEADSSK